MKQVIFGTLLAVAFGFSLAACNDDEVFEGSYISLQDGASGALHLDGTDAVDTLKIVARTMWTATLENESDASWLTLSPSSGYGGYENIIVTATDNGTSFQRTANIIITASGQTIVCTVTQDAADFRLIDPADIADYDKFFPNSEHGPGILRSDSRYSFFHFAQSDHFFVFWDAMFFGDDPGAASLGDSAVDIDDLLEKAEGFFSTNIYTLGMADLGAGKSYLDIYKMQIYILDPTDEWWVATGSGYDNTIGALWVTPSTMQPVGSTIAHEIGHSFQYQVYADKLYQGATDDYTTGFRYGYPNSNGGCGYWEQCAQWQSYLDYPDEQFTSYNFDVWVANCHRHFEHEWQRYASYWLQSYWVDKHGIEAFANIWKNSEYPNDAIETYTNVYNGGYYEITREELFDYAMRMATFDIDFLPEIKEQYIDVYSTSLLKTDDGGYQVAYASCPQATGFNVIPLTVPEAGTDVIVTFEGLEVGAPLHESDPGNIVDGDGATIGTTTTYNNVGTTDDMGWRYGFVAYGNGTRTYSLVGTQRNGAVHFDVPEGTEYLYLVVQGSPETYKQNPWDEDESNDYQYPYKIYLTNASIRGLFDIDEDADPTDVDITLNISVSAGYEDYLLYEYDLANYDICQAFVIQPDVFSGLLVTDATSAPAAGKIVLANRNASGVVEYGSTANDGCWIGSDGSIGYWGSDASGYFEKGYTTTLSIGHFPGNGEAGTTVTLRPTLVYNCNGTFYYANITANLNYQ